MGKKGDKAIDDIIDKFRVFMIAVILIYVAFAIIGSLIKDIPFWMQIILGSLFVLFVYSVRDNAKEFIKNLSRKI
jgi:hypothetical protein